MFTLEQITLAHTTVKSGADFPNYIRQLKVLGVTHYDHYVRDGRNHFFEDAGFEIQGPAKYKEQTIADQGSERKLKEALSIHQQGQTDYPTFCRQAGEAGVEKWTTDIVAMKVTYFDKKGNALVIEIIPGL